MSNMKDAKGPPAVLEAMRPRHWIKNAFVLPAILFSGHFTDPVAWARALWAVAVFCFLSSAAYLFNDVLDRHCDRLHPIKKDRPVASGRLSVRGALAAAAVLALIGSAAAVGLSVWIWPLGEAPYGATFLAWSFGYLALNMAYSVRLKRVAVLDVIAVAFGFVLRAMAGAAAILVPISPWLIVCTLTLCLYIAVTKRRGEPVMEPAGKTFDAADLEHMIDVATTMALLTYSLYCLAPMTVARIGSAHLIWTIPLAFYGLFRFNRVSRAAEGLDPVTVLYRDKVMWAVVVAYVILAGLIVKWGRHVDIGLLTS